MNTTKKLSVSQNAFYNTVGSLVYCFCQWITSALLVVHLSPKDISVTNAGILQLAISVTNIFYAISCYNVRTYQISDVKNTYSDGDYIGTRFVTAGISLILCLGYVAILNYSIKNIFCILFYMIYKLNETFSDVLHGIDQKHYRMDYVGISYCLRGILSVIAFTVIMLLTGDVLFAVLAMAVVSIAVVVFYDVKCTATLGSVKPVFNKKAISSLLVICLPAVIASSTFTAITTLPRQMLENMRGEEALGYYGTVATPVIIVQILATSIFNPMLTELAEYYNSGDTKRFYKRLANNLLILMALTALTALGVLILGKFAVGLVFGKKFVPYTGLMYGIIGCTAIYTVSWLCTNVLIIVRKLKTCMTASIISLVVSALCAKPFINMFEMDGVSISIILAYAVHILICSTVIIKTLKGVKKI